MDSGLGRIEAILNCFSTQRPSVSFSEVVQLTGLSKGTVHRMLTNLEERHWLSRDRETKRYALGSNMVRWGALALDSIDVRWLAEPLLQRLHAKTRETVSLYRNDGDRRMKVAGYDSVNY